LLSTRELNEYDYFLLLGRKPAHLHERKVAQKLGSVTILKNAQTAGKLEALNEWVHLAKFSIYLKD